MSRTYVDVKIKKSPVLTDIAARKILSSANYHEVGYRDGYVWKKCFGLLAAMQYIRLDYQGDTLHISGWIQTGIGGAAAKEHDLGGRYGTFSKNAVWKTIQQIRTEISRL